MTEAIVHKWAMIINLIIGVAFVGIALTSFNHMTHKCTSGVLNNGMNIILGIGAVLITLAVVFFSCSGDGLDCYDMGAPQAATIYLVSTIVVAVIVLALSGAMLKELNREVMKKSCGRHIKTMVILLMVISVVSAGVSGFSLLRLVNLNKVDEEDNGDAPKRKAKKPKGLRLFMNDDDDDDY